MIQSEMVQVYRCTCNLCKHTWTSMNLPLRCAKCKRVEWNRSNPEPTNSIPAKALEGVLEGVSVKSTLHPSHDANCTCILCLLTKGKTT